MPEQFRERSLLPVDVGFDLRNTGHSVRVYDGFSYRYLDLNNKKSYVYPEADAGTTGGLVAVAEALARSGYCVVPLCDPVWRDICVVPSGIAEEEGKIVWNVRYRHGEHWRQGDTLREALSASGWEPDDTQPLSHEEY